MNFNITINNLVCCEHCGSVYDSDFINLYRNEENRLVWKCIVCGNETDE